MNVHLINPSDVSFGTAVITPRWQYVLAAATPKSFGDPKLVDETLFQTDPVRIQQGDAVGGGWDAGSQQTSMQKLQSRESPLLPGWRGRATQDH